MTKKKIFKKITTFVVKIYCFIEYVWNKANMFENIGLNLRNFK